MTIKLYKSDFSPPVRAVMMTCDILNVEFDPIEVNVLEGKHLSDSEFLRVNPLHKIPVLVDGDLVIHDSHAMLMYLVDKFGKDDTLYPKDLIKRTLVNQKLFFDISTLFQRLTVIARALLFEGATTIPEQQQNDVYEAYGFLEEFLSQSKYLASDEITIADISAITYVTSTDQILPIDPFRYPKTIAWIKNLEKKSYFKKYNAPGNAILGERLKKQLKMQ